MKTKLFAALASLPLLACSGSSFSSSSGKAGSKPAATASGTGTGTGSGTGTGMGSGSAACKHATIGASTKGKGRLAIKLTDPADAKPGSAVALVQAPSGGDSTPVSADSVRAEVALTDGQADTDLALTPAVITALQGAPDDYSLQLLAPPGEGPRLSLWSCALPRDAIGPLVPDDEPNTDAAAAIGALPPDLERKCAGLAEAAKAAPSPISTAADLRAVKSGKAYILTDDIALDGDWKPLGDKVVTKSAGGDDLYYPQAVLSGTVIDGRGHKITGLKLHSAEEGRAVGLIATLYCGVVSNLVLDGIDATLLVGVGFGALAGSSVNSYIEDVTVTHLTLAASGAGFYGGLVGFFDGIDGATAGDASAPQVRRVKILGADIKAVNLIGGVFGIAKDIWVEDITVKDASFTSTVDVMPGIGGVAGGDNGGGGVKIGKANLAGITVSASCGTCGGPYVGGVIANTVGAADRFYDITLTSPFTVSTSGPGAAGIGTVVGSAYTGSAPEISDVAGTITGTANGAALASPPQIGIRQ